MEDNFYRASTERLFGTDRAIRERLAKEKLAFEREKPIYVAIKEHLEDRITELEKITSIKATDNPEQFMREVAINQGLCEALKRELNLIEVKVKMFSEKE